MCLRGVLEEEPTSNGCVCLGNCSFINFTTLLGYFEPDGASWQLQRAGVREEPLRMCMYRVEA